jgi:hypothetical protein
MESVLLVNLCSYLEDILLAGRYAGRWKVCSQLEGMLFVGDILYSLAGTYAYGRYLGS